MPNKRVRQSKNDRAENELANSRLTELGILTPRPKNPQPKRFELKMSCREPAQVHDLPVNFTAVVVPMLVIITKPIMFTDARVVRNWGDEWPLDPDAPPDFRYWRAVTEDFEDAWSSRILNAEMLDREHPLGPCQLKGVFIATGWPGVPVNYPNEKRLNLTLYLEDENSNEYPFEFSARIDRREMTKYQRRKAELRPIIEEKLRNRVPLFHGYPATDIAGSRDSPARERAADKGLSSKRRV